MREAASIILLRRRSSRVRGVPRPPASRLELHGVRVRVSRRRRRAGEDARTAAARELFEEAGVLLASDPATGAETLEMTTHARRCASSSSTARRRADARAAGLAWSTDVARAVVALDHAVDRAEAILRAVLRRRAAGRAGAVVRRRSRRSIRCGCTPADAIARAASCSCRRRRSARSGSSRSIGSIERRDRAPAARAPTSRIRSCRACAGVAGEPPCLLLPWDPEYPTARHRREHAADVSAGVGAGPSRFVVEDRAWKHVAAPGSTSAG